MNYLKPLKSLPTHDVDNMPPYMGHQNLWLDDINLREAVNREGANWAEKKLLDFGALMEKQKCLIMQIGRTKTPLN